MSFRKTLLITGASSGFGQALAREALNSGHRVVGTVRSEEARSALEAVAPGQ
ncbi:MAG: SDR family NAD(P)-dependent oxidoreductase, partial [Pseudomonas aeruginosa]|nr:SDR family NAD(P)-dependent oxidoreductase [Pseudomonas aeruginosa]